MTLHDNKIFTKKSLKEKRFPLEFKNKSIVCRDKEDLMF